MKTEWNLALLYDSLTDPRIERDVVESERACKKFAKDFNVEDAAWPAEPAALFTALERYESLELLPVERALRYAYFTRELDGSRAEADALLMRLDDRVQKMGSLVLFFENRLAKIPKDLQKVFLAAPELGKHHYALKRLFMLGKHQLSEQEERVLLLTNAPRTSLWISGVDKLLNKQIITVGKESLPINEALSKVPYFNTAKKRRLWWRATTDVLKSISDFPESEINALFTNKKVSDELRGHKKPYDATILSYENSPKSVMSLVHTVTDSFSVAHDFYKLKSEMLGEDLTYVDRSAPIGKSNKEISFTQAVDIVRGAFTSAHPRYAHILDEFLCKGHIDVYPKQGKTGGAYCAAGSVTPTFVLLNHTNDFNSLKTLAHEMGHAIHSERTKEAQPVTYFDYSTAVAETASTFFERVVFNNVFETLSDTEKVVALHDKIQDDIATIFRQIAFFNFELDLHNAVRTEGWVSKETIASLLAQHLRAYLGKDVAVSDDDGYSFVYVGHFRRPFYVYSYAFGQLISNALYEKYREDKSYIEKVDQFLAAGGSDTPENIFKKIGIDVTKPEFWQSGIATIKRDIQTLRTLAHK